MRHVNHVLALISVITLSSFSFFSSLSGGFAFDDIEAVINNRDVKGNTPWSSILYDDFWGKSLNSKTSHKSFRPLTTAVFRLLWFLSEGAFIFHLTNLVLYTLLCGLTYLVFFDLTGDTLWGWLAAVLFATHPVHAEPVCSVVGLSDLLCAVLSVGALLCYLQSCPSQTTSNGPTPKIWVSPSHLYKGSSQPPGLHHRGRKKTHWSRIAAYWLALAGMLAKEHGIMMFVMFVVYDVVHSASVHPWFYPPVRWKRISWPIIMAFSLVILRIWWQGGAPPTFQPEDNPAAFAPTFWQRLMTHHYVYSLNLWILLCPWWLCFDWAMGCVPVIQDPLEARVLAPLLLWTCICGLLIKTWKKALSSHDQSLLLSCAWLVLPFLPASNLFFTVGFVIAERMLLLPSVGFCALVALGGRTIHSLLSSRGQKVLLAFFLLLISLHITRSIHRSVQWKRESTLFRSGLQVCPNNAKVHYNIAKNAADEGEVDTALLHYQMAIRLNPRYLDAMNNLGNLLKQQGHLEMAREFLINATRTKSDSAPAWMNLGAVLAEMGDNQGAERAYTMAINLRPNYPDCFYNLANLLGNTYGKMGNYQESENHFLRAIQLNPNAANYVTNLGVLYHRWGKSELAEEAYKRSLQMDPSYKKAHENLRLLRERKKKEQRSDKVGGAYPSAAGSTGKR
ncbi:unnamed protein product [Cyprideis torosa]|uniref:dolichyl-phosphate-mannose--protein mannosyltransferase n=1 Tax=Cyprideis torosa TaxID=163714 RepID=A0A7R8W026_9CRUS|nr:unnamed protein product [Cyprideis torosa]CAG0879112.1 unnamed protein product [Cyprideis torosa]